eukprot:TRINITY_DN27389_c0_g1_i1.p1 TRINITY_DN27389_c0_g1~~TRINITY_DN27389_c0_g1_i1.p1  ORF type:complete len:364 (+),score=110.85 TRINITY_DN27389_c0_g1_i1:86-1093(+)
MALLHVSPCQQGNPVLRYLPQGGWRFEPSAAFDYELPCPRGASGGAKCLFLSLKYHGTHPHYLQQRLRRLTGGGGGGARCLVMQADAQSPEGLATVNEMCVANGLTLLVGWSAEECAGYLVALTESPGRGETLRGRSAWRKDAQGRDNASAAALLSGAVRRLSRPDAERLLRGRSLAAALQMTQGELEGLPGMGGVKAAALRALAAAPLVPGGGATPAGGAAERGELREGDPRGAGPPADVPRQPPAAAAAPAAAAPPPAAAAAAPRAAPAPCAAPEAPRAAPTVGSEALARMHAERKRAAEGGGSDSDSEGAAPQPLRPRRQGPPAAGGGAGAG